MSIYFISMVGVGSIENTVQENKYWISYILSDSEMRDCLTDWASDSKAIHSSCLKTIQISWRSSRALSRQIKAAEWSVSCRITGYLQPQKITDSYYNHNWCGIIVEVKLFDLIGPFTGASVCSVCPAGSYTKDPGDKQQHSMQWWILYTLPNQPDRACRRIRQGWHLTLVWARTYDWSLNLRNTLHNNFASAYFAWVGKQSGRCAANFSVTWQRSWLEMGILGSGCLEE